MAVSGLIVRSLGGAGSGANIPDLILRGLMAAPGGASAVFTDIRVETVSIGSTIIRWTTNGLNSTGIYRSTDGVIYALVGTVTVGVEEFVDTGLDEKVKYWYRLSDDSAFTVSSAVTVVSMVDRSRRQGNSSQFVATQDLESLARQLEDKLNGQDVASQPCGLCIVDGAMVIDCTQGCEWFRVIMDQDVNSISLIGCDDCPPVDFIVPPNVTRGICGWPVGCDFQGDECFQAPIVGGAAGRTGKTTGESFDGYGGGSFGAAKSGPCPCPTNTLGALQIVCCEEDDDCTLVCAGKQSMSVRACGGLAPYSWSIAGSILTLTDAVDISVAADIGEEGATISSPNSARTRISISDVECAGGATCGFSQVVTEDLAGCSESNAPFNCVCTGGTAPYTTTRHRTNGTEIPTTPLVTGEGQSFPVPGCLYGYGLPLDEDEIIIRTTDSVGSVCNTTVDVSCCRP